MADTVRKLQSFQHNVEERMRQELGIRPRVRLVEPKTIPDTPGRRSPGDRRSATGCRVERIWYTARTALEGRP